jgi:hypothetical protein
VSHATAQQPELLPATTEPSTALSTAVVPSEGANLVLMFERLAKDPAVDVAKLEKLIELQERIMRHNAKAAFDGAFSRMQAELPVVDERGQILVKGQLRSTYAKLEDIHDVVKPIMKTFGFAMRHRTEWPADKAGIIRIIGILSHEQGHSEQSEFEAPMDRSEYRTDIQSQGSTLSYGRRYTTLDLLNISTRGLDDDGKKSGRSQPPEGYDEWLVGMSELASKGLAALQVEFQKSKPEFRAFVTQHDALTWAKIKTRASAVKVTV